jgi:hypothetical protein
VLLGSYARGIIRRGRRLREPGDSVGQPPGNTRRRRTCNVWLTFSELLPILLSLMVLISFFSSSPDLLLYDTSDYCGWNLNLLGFFFHFFHFLFKFGQLGANLSCECSFFTDEDKQQIQNFGDPFFLAIHECETLAELKGTHREISKSPMRNSPRLSLL